MTLLHFYFFFMIKFKHHIMHTYFIIYFFELMNELELKILEYLDKLEIRITDPT